MIIASPAKKENSIPLEPINSSGLFKKDKTEKRTEDYVLLQPRLTGQQDMVCQIFGQASLCDVKVQETMTLHTTLTLPNQSSTKTLCCEAFILDQTVFLNSPFNSALLVWANGEFQSCITHLIELAEEKTECSTLIVSLNRHLYKDTTNTLLRAFMYMGFQMIDPSIYRQEQGHVFLGYEL
ncbi:hypothetical protein BY458DRAFT_501605 [Sporodiniella umbellata]|nr:hypothetical protein BY458DRAFT_501605 [Sporodiniella umbellata]